MFGVIGTALISAGAPASAAVVNALPCPKPLPSGQAPCYPGDLYRDSSGAHNVYSGAAYDCGSLHYWGYHYKYNWPSMRTCMDYYLIVNGTSNSAHKKHLTDLYIHYHSDLDFWNKYNTFVNYWLWTLASMGEIAYKALEPTLCVYITAGTAGDAAVISGLGCSYIITYFAAKGW